MSLKTCMSGNTSLKSKSPESHHDPQHISDSYLPFSIKKLKEKLAAQRKHLDEVEEHINEMEKAASAKPEATA